MAGPQGLQMPLNKHRFPVEHIDIRIRDFAMDEQEHAALFESRDTKFTPPPTDEAKLRPHFRSTAPAVPSPDFQAPIDLSRMSLFEVGSRVRPLLSRLFQSQLDRQDIMLFED